MRLLLDTHVWLWMMQAPEKLSGEARDALANIQNELFLSAASVWEAGIKQALGKLTLPGSLRDLVLSSLQDFQLQRLPISFEHAACVSSLPLHHRDPFDRMLIAQARTEELVLMTADPALRAYEQELFWAT